MRFTKTAGAAVLAALPVALAQTFTECNPLEKTCPKNTGLNSATFSSDFASDPKAEASWSKAAYTTINYDKQGAQFRISKAGEAPTMSQNFYFFFGRVDVTMKPAPGQGIVSSIVLESDDLDEVDWEFLGGVPGSVQTNFFGKGNTTSYDRMIQYNVDAAQDVYHTYSLDWTAERLQWIIDGTVVRELKYTDAVALNGKTYPQTPMQLKLGNWAAGGPGVPEGTVQWAGGKTDFTQGPFDMYVQKVSITNYNPADSYEYGDKSGSWQSIKINKDGSSASPSGSGSGSSSITSSVADSATSKPEANTTAPESSSSTEADTKSDYTSKASVAPLDQHTKAANSVTQTGSMYSTNTASASALNSAINASTLATTLSAATTSASTSSPTDSSSGAGAGYGNGTSDHNSTTHQPSTSSGAPPAEQTGNAGVALKGGMTACSVVGLALGVLFL